MAKEKLVFLIFIISVLTFTTISAEEFGYNLLPEPTFDNNTAFVNNSEFCGGILCSLYALLDGSNTPFTGPIEITPSDNTGLKIAVDSAETEKRALWLTNLQDNKGVKIVFGEGGGSNMQLGYNGQSNLLFFGNSTTNALTIDRDNGNVDIQEDLLLGDFTFMDFDTSTPDITVDDVSDRTLSFKNLGAGQLKLILGSDPLTIESNSGQAIFRTSSNPIDFITARAGDDIDFQPNSVQTLKISDTLITASKQFFIDGAQLIVKRSASQIHLIENDLAVDEEWHLEVDDNDFRIVETGESIWLTILNGTGEVQVENNLTVGENLQVNGNANVGENLTVGKNLTVLENFLARTYRTTGPGTLGFNYYDDGSDLFMNVSNGGGDFAIEQDNTKFVLFNQPNAANDFMVAQLFSKEAGDVQEFVITKGGFGHTDFHARSLSVGVNNFNCSTFANFISCDTDVTGGDLFVADEAEINGSLFVAGGLFNVTDDGDIVSAGGLNVTGNLTVDTTTFHIDSDNDRVGIGTSSPSSILDIAGSANDLIINMDNSQTDSLTGINLKNDVRQWQLQVRGDTSDSFLIRDNTAGAYRLAIDSSGNVGINTSTPQNTLNVVGDLNVTGESNFGGILDLNNNSLIDVAELNMTGPINLDNNNITNVSHITTNHLFGTALTSSADSVIALTEGADGFIGRGGYIRTDEDSSRFGWIESIFDQSNTLVSDGQITFNLANGFLVTGTYIYNATAWSVTEPLTSLAITPNTFFGNIVLKNSRDLTLTDNGLILFGDSGDVESKFNSTGQYLRARVGVVTNFISGFVRTQFDHNVSILGNLTVDTLFAEAVNISNSSFFFGDNENSTIDYTVQNFNNGSNASTILSIKNDVGGRAGIGIASSGFLLRNILTPNATGLFSSSKGQTLFLNTYDEPFVWYNNPQDDNNLENIEIVMTQDNGNLNISGNLTHNGTITFPHFTEPNPLADSVLMWCESDNRCFFEEDDGDKRRILTSASGSDVIDYVLDFDVSPMLNFMNGTFVGGSAYVCIWDNGSLYSSEDSC